jgi:hypothetical protein
VKRSRTKPKRSKATSILVGLLLSLSAICMGETNLGYMVCAEAGTNQQGQHTLRFQVSNNTSNAVSMYQSDLPWCGRYNCVIVAVRVNSSPLSIIDPVRTISDIGLKKVSLLPGKMLQGEIMLSSWVHDFDAIVKEESVLVFWSYLLRDRETRASLRFGGWLSVDAPRTADGVPVKE